LYESIESKTSAYGNDDRQHTSNDERAHGERFFEQELRKLIITQPQPHYPISL